MELQGSSDIPAEAGLRAHWTIAMAAAVAMAGVAAAVLLMAWPASSPENGIRLPVLAGPIPGYETMFSTVLHVEVAWAADQWGRPRPERDPGACSYRVSNEGASLEELDAKLLQLAQREIDALGTSEAVVTISCDEDLAYEAVRRILESCRRATIWRVWLLGREDDLTSPGGWSTRFHPLPLGRPAPGGARDDPAAPAALVLHLAPADPPGGVGSIHLGAVAVADLADLEKTISKELSARERREVELAIRIEDGVRWGDAVQAICVARRALEAEHELFVEVED